ncbi:Hypothetical predicted protein [Pelobates cultripes]|uniref:Transposase n=1 Tax=Pelobates cultripes TaxID=61616 RepID=A0AAD1W718_PELCU|nr:Hypothetical predicted protein [Pelobates cultripes]
MATHKKTGKKTGKKTKDGTLSVADLLTTPRPHVIKDGGGQMSAGSPDSPSTGEHGHQPPQTSNAEILRSLAEVRHYLAGEIERSAWEVKEEIQTVGQRTEALEWRMDHVVAAHNEAASTTNHLITRVAELEAEIEDASNRSRRNNLRIKGLPERIKDADIQKVLLGLFKEQLPAIPEHLWTIDRAHRALRARGPPDSPPRDVIMRWHFFSTKEAIIKSARHHTYSLDGSTLHLYQDIAPATLARRREWKPIADFVRAKGLNFAWGHPFKMLVFNGPRPDVLLPSADPKTFLRNLGIEVPEDFSLPHRGTQALGHLPREEAAQDGGVH